MHKLYWIAAAMCAVAAPAGATGDKLTLIAGEREPAISDKPTDAAKILGLDRKTLYRKLLRWGVSDE